MATQTPLTHPKQESETSGFYRYLATFLSLDDDGAETPVGMESDIRCAYMPSGGSEVVGFEVEQSTKDMVLLCGWYPSIQTKWVVELLLLDRTPYGRFRIDDVLTNDSSQSKTLMTVSPN